MQVAPGGDRLLAAAERAPARLAKEEERFPLAKPGWETGSLLFILAHLCGVMVFVAAAVGGAAMASGGGNRPESSVCTGRRGACQVCRGWRARWPVLRLCARDLRAGRGRPEGCQAPCPPGVSPLRAGQGREGQELRHRSFGHMVVRLVAAPGDFRLFRPVQSGPPGLDQGLRHVPEGRDGGG